jgi:hypothetical protein
MATANGLNVAQNLYAAFYFRAADPAGQDYWATQIDNNGGNAVDSILNAFAASTEEQDLYSTYSTTDFINAVYQNLFGRTADAGGLSYWQGQIDSGAITRIKAAISIFNAASGGDATVLSGKMQTSATVTGLLREHADWNAGYTGVKGDYIGRQIFANWTTGVAAGQPQPLSSLLQSLNLFFGTAYTN